MKKTKSPKISTRLRKSNLGPNSHMPVKGIKSLRAVKGIYKYHPCRISVPLTVIKAKTSNSKLPKTN